MKNAAIVLLFAAMALGQDSTPPANCALNPNAVNTVTTNCTSVLQQQSQRPDTVQLYQQGYQVGHTIGNVVANRRANRWIKKYCKIHPGEAWWYTSTATGYLDGTCPD